MSTDPLLVPAVISRSGHAVLYVNSASSDDWQEPFIPRHHPYGDQQ